MQLISNSIKKITLKNFIILFFFLSLIFGGLIFPKILTKKDIFIILSELMIVRALFYVPKFFRHMMRVQNSGASVSKKIISIFPSQLIALATLEIAQQRGFINWLMNKKPVIQIDGEIFTHWQKSQYATFFLIILLACITDLPLSIFLVNILLKNDPNVIIIHYVSVLSGIYFLMWVIADRYLVKNSCQVAGADHLSLTIGARFSANIPWETISDCALLTQTKELSESRSAWLIRNGFKPESTLLATPMDQPNIVVKLKNLDRTFIEKFKIQRNDIDTLMLYVDEPDSFLRTIKKRIQVQCTN